MTIFSCNSISKTFLDNLLFDNISFGMEEGERIGVIGRNGAGKSTLLRLIAGHEVSDSGIIAFNNNMRMEYLEQLPAFAASDSVLHTVMGAKPEVRGLIDEYENLCKLMSEGSSEELETKFANVSHEIDLQDGWNLENDAKTILSKLGITRFDENVMNLSGGQRKRVALSRALLSKPDLLILDEPTNHLDADSVQWLQDYLQNSNLALLLVTHDRYFLDAVATRIVEIDRKTLFTYSGNFEYYLEKKEAALDTEERTSEHERNKLRNELVWLQKGAKARRTKQKSRIDWIAKMQAQPKVVEQKNIKIELGNKLLGGKIIDVGNLSKSINGKVLFKNFNYKAAPGDRIGIIGANGAGKSTLLNIIAGRIQPDTGWANLGETVTLGYFDQETKGLKDSQTLIGTLRDIAEFIDTGLGKDRFLTAKDLLDRFNFPPRQHHSQVATLSGGEKRRLYLCTILMKNPNVLFFDEPTNDFDIQTLNSLEEYLDNFLGVLVIVSHDRSFLDKTVERIYCFEEGGIIKEYPGNYSAYLEKKEAAAKLQKQSGKAPEKQTVSAPEIKIAVPSQKKKNSFHEKKEFDIVEKKIAEIEAQKSVIEKYLESGITDYKELSAKADELAKLELSLDELTVRWIELGEKMEA
ncbi:MAG: ABC-F family ATP-binding cassette domain-containing protein [Ignavibacteriae bacterium]|nr:ABC-F family ATP-binding cassette domain-containing protein [Ignavibacteriota bacterium]